MYGSPFTEYPLTYKTENDDRCCFCSCTRIKRKNDDSNNNTILFQVVTFLVRFKILIILSCDVGGVRGVGFVVVVIVVDDDDSVVDGVFVDGVVAAVAAVVDGVVVAAVAAVVDGVVVVTVYLKVAVVSVGVASRRKQSSIPVSFLRHLLIQLLL
jgi:hypothetical protein